MRAAARIAPVSPEPDTQTEFLPDRPISARPFLLAKQEISPDFRFENP